MMPPEKPRNPATTSSGVGEGQSGVGQGAQVGGAEHKAGAGHDAEVAVAKATFTASSKGDGGTCGAVSRRWFRTTAPPRANNAAPVPKLMPKAKLPPRLRANPSTNGYGP